MSGRRLRVAGLVAATVLLASCGSGGGTSPAPTTAPTARVWPLTGLPDDGAAQGPALAVKIENSAAARPQTGLGAADVVWEEVVEGGITRFVAVYHSTVPDEIGPVRSVRPMDAAIAGPLHGLFAFSGGLQPFVDALDAAGLQTLSNDAGAGGFHRVDTRPAPHNVYADPHTLLAQADEQHRDAPDEQFAFDADRPTTGTPATTLDLTLSGASHPSWTWSAADRVWLRAEDGSPAVDAAGGRIDATTVVVLRVDLVTTDFTDPAGNPVPETQLVGSGAAVVAAAGTTVEATWSKQSVTAPVVLSGADGQPVVLAPGPVWIELVPNGSGAVTVG